MKNKKIIESVLTVGGYAFSVLGGVIGLVIGAFLAASHGEKAEKHGKTIILASVGTVALYAFFASNRMSILTADSTTPLLLAYFVLSAIAGGLIAVKKEDFFTRGFFTALLTGVWGISVLVFAQPSKARENQSKDRHYWPRESWIALLLMAANILVLVIAGNIFPQPVAP